MPFPILREEWMSPRFLPAWRHADRFESCDETIPGRRVDRPSASALMMQEMPMARKTSQDWMTTGFSLWQLGAEANSVVMLRMAQFAMGGPSAQKEAQLMIAEKVQAAAELQMRLMTGTLGATPLSGTNKTISHYQRKVSANKKRLSKAKS